MSLKTSLPEFTDIYIYIYIYIPRNGALHNNPLAVFVGLSHITIVQFLFLFFIWSCFYHLLDHQSCK